MEHVARVKPVRFPAASVRIAVVVAPLRKFVRVVDPDLDHARIERVQPLQGASMAHHKYVRVSIVIPAVLEIGEKLDWRLERIRLETDEWHCLMPHDAVLLLVHQIERHLAKSFRQGLQAGEVRNLRHIRAKLFISRAEEQLIDGVQADAGALASIIADPVLDLSH